MIDILMPVHNCENYVCDAVESMLNQTYQNFRLMVFNDGSTDNTKEILLSYNDNRIRYFESEQNIGCTNALNALLKVSDAKYIARMDADDVSLPNRLELQLNFMESNPDFVLCGSGICVFGCDYPETDGYYPENSEEIRVNLLTNNCIGHPTVMFRNGLFTYDNQFEHAEDYHAWANLSKNKNNLMTNIPEVLLKYRLHSQQVSAQKRALQFSTSNKIKTQLLHNISRNFTTNEVDIYLFLVNATWKDFREDCAYSMDEMESLVKKVILLNNERKLYDSQILTHHLQNYLKIIAENFAI
jgi:glycosyltransferase involved in cell wall biosynthesis